MKYEEYEKIVEMLQERGYKKRVSSKMCSKGDFYLWKSFGRECNPYEEGCALYTLILKLFDWRKYQTIDKSLIEDSTIKVKVIVSRCIDEKLIELKFDLPCGNLDIEAIEFKAHAFYCYIDEFFELGC